VTYKKILSFIISHGILITLHLFTTQKALMDGLLSLGIPPAYTPEVLFIFGCCDVTHKIIFIVDVVVCTKL
jgi:hypothetical protein